MTRFSIPDMSCGHCKSTIEAALMAVDPLAELDFDMDAREVSVDTDLDQAKVLETLEKAGYPAKAL